MGQKASNEHRYFPIEMTLVTRAADGDDSSHPFEWIRTDRRIQLAIATVLLLAVLVIVSLLVL